MALAAGGAAEVKCLRREDVGLAGIIGIVATIETEPDLPLKVEPLLLEVADVVNTTLDLDTSLRRVAELVRKVIDYEIFAILLLNEKTQELRVRFQIGYPRESAERIRIKVGQGVTGAAAQRREAAPVAGVSNGRPYNSAVPNLRSELGPPLILKKPGIR